MLKSIKSNYLPARPYNRHTSVVDLSTDFSAGNILKRNNKMIKTGDIFQDYYKKGVEIAVEKSMGKWKTVSFNLKSMSAHEVGTNNTLEKQKSMNLSSSDKMKIKKIVKNPQEADFINQDDSNMTKKILTVLR